MVSLEHNRCLGCGYILDHLPEPRCPECGRGFDLTDPRTFQARAESGRMYLRVALLCAAVMIAASAASALFAPDGLRAPIFWLAVPWLLGVLGELSVIIGGIIVLLGPAYRAEQRPQIVAGIAVAIGALGGSVWMAL